MLVDQWSPHPLFSLPVAEYTAQLLTQPLPLPQSYYGFQLKRVAHLPASAARPDALYLCAPTWEVTSEWLTQLTYSASIADPTQFSRGGSGPTAAATAAAPTAGLVFAASQGLMAGAAAVHAHAAGYRQGLAVGRDGFRDDDSLPALHVELKAMDGLGSGSGSGNGSGRGRSGGNSSGVSKKQYHVVPVDPTVPPHLRPYAAPQPLQRVVMQPYRSAVVASGVGGNASTAGAGGGHDVATLGGGTVPVGASAAVSQSTTNGFSGTGYVGGVWIPGPGQGSSGDGGLGMPTDGPGAQRADAGVPPSSLDVDGHARAGKPSPKSVVRGTLVLHCAVCAVYCTALCAVCLVFVVRGRISCGAMKAQVTTGRG